SRSCMPSPLLRSLMTMIGLSAARSVFDLTSPRQSARNPPTELALPRSTANSVRCTLVETLSGAASLSPEGCAAAVSGDAGGAGLAGSLARSLAGSSLEAAGSAGAISDFGGKSELTGAAAGALGDGAVEAIFGSDDAAGVEAWSCGGMATEACADIGAGVS